MTADEPGTDEQTETETETTSEPIESDGTGPASEVPGSDGNEASGTTGGGERSLQERLDAFPWLWGMLAGAVSFVVSYLLLVGWVLLGPAKLPGTLVGQLKRVGFLLYNAQGVLVVAEAGANTTALPINLLPQASLPFVYRMLPAVVLVVASAAFTHLRWVEDTDILAALATGAAVALGYLAVGLVGTFVFVLTQTGPQYSVVYHPNRTASFLFITGYGLVFGILGSMLVRARGRPS